MKLEVAQYEIINISSLLRTLSAPVFLRSETLFSSPVLIKVEYM